MELKDIKQQFFTYRNGMLADRLREAGDCHKVIFGLNLPQIVDIARMAGCNKALAEELFEMEKAYPGSVSLSAGSCSTCGKDGCTRPSGKPCRYPDKMRYSIEALGGNVGKTVHDLLGIELEWIEEGKAPSYFVLAGGLLEK